MSNTRSLEIRKKISKTLKKIGHKPPNRKGIKLSKEHKRKISEAHKGKKASLETREKLSLSHKGQKNWCKGKKLPYPIWNKGLTKEKDDRVVQTWLGKKRPDMAGENNCNWRGGISFKSYGLEFNKKLKEKIRKRDNFTCQECKYTQKELGYTLHIHHIDYNKKNNNPENLISLCRSCHTKTNFNRNDWIKYYQRKLI